MTLSATQLALGVAVLVLVIVVIAACAGGHIRQAWSQVGMARYPPAVDPAWYGPGAINFVPYSAPDWYPATSPPLREPSSDQKQATLKLLEKWYAFADALNPQMREALYMLFPDLTTREGLAYYGLTARMVRTLSDIEPLLNDPSTIKGERDIMRIFGPVATQIFNEEIASKPMSGMYKNEQSCGWGANVV